MGGGGRDSLVIIAALTLIALLVMKVALIILFAVLFVTGPVVIALYPLPEMSHLARGWATALLSVILIPVGWCVIFAGAGALMGDMGGFSHTRSHSPIDPALLGVIAGLLTFYMAYKWPLIILGQVKTLAGSFGVSAGTGGGIRGVVSSAGTRVSGYKQVAGSLTRVARPAAALGTAALRGVTHSTASARGVNKSGSQTGPQTRSARDDSTPGASQTAATKTSSRVTKPGRSSVANSDPSQPRTPNNVTDREEKAGRSVPSVAENQTPRREGNGGKHRPPKPGKAIPASSPKTRVNDARDSARSPGATGERSAPPTTDRDAKPPSTSTAVRSPQKQQTSRNPAISTAASAGSPASSKNEAAGSGAKQLVRVARDIQPQTPDDDSAGPPKAKTRDRSRDFRSRGDSWSRTPRRGGGDR